MADFPGVITTFARGLRSKIAASSVTSTMHRIYTDETGGVYAGDSSTPLSSLKRLLRIDENSLNLTHYGVVYGSTSNTAVISANTTAVQNWLNDISSTGKDGLITGMVTINTDAVSIALVGAHIYGWTERRCGFIAATSGARLIDLRNSYHTVIERIKFDGNNLAQCALDLGNSTVGASAGNIQFRVWARASLDRQIDLTNNGDTVNDMCTISSLPDSACGLYWPNSGGNVMVWRPKFLAGTGATAPVRASIEASFQNMTVVDGGVTGLRILDNGTSQSLSIRGTQFYAVRDGFNLSGPQTGNGVYVVDISAATKFAVNTPTQCYFDGIFQFMFGMRGGSMNSNIANAITTGGPNNNGFANAFGPAFAPGNVDTLRIEFTGNFLRSEPNSNTAVFNLPSNSQWSRTVLNNHSITDIVDSLAATTMTASSMNTGDGVTTGTGLSIGGGTMVKKLDSIAPGTWNPGVVASGGFAATTVTYTGAVPGQWIGLGISPATTLPAGLLFGVEIMSNNNVRISVFNLSGTPQTLPALSPRLYKLNV